MMVIIKVKFMTPWVTISVIINISRVVKVVSPKLLVIMRAG